MGRDSTVKTRTARHVLVRAVMSRARIEALLAAVLASCGGVTESGPSGSSSGGSSGDWVPTSSSSGSPATWVDACGGNREKTTTFDLATSCANYEARLRAASDGGADNGAADSGAADSGSDGSADGGSDDAGAEAGTFDCAAVSCGDLCVAAFFGGWSGGGEDACKKTATELSCTVRHPCGRRFHRMEEPATNDVLRDAAYLEAASVIAFEHLARDLAFHEAPFGLIAAAVRAGEDERRHTALVHALAGGASPEPHAQPWRARKLVDIAIENAVEGCVGETWGALVALAQARDASSPEVRAVYASIAPDEIGHAALAYEIDAWLRPLLTPEERTAVDTAKAAAWARYEIDIDAGTAARLGIPNGDTSRTMLKALASAA